MCDRRDELRSDDRATGEQRASEQRATGEQTTAADTPLCLGAQPHHTSHEVRHVESSMQTERIPLCVLARSRLLDLYLVILDCNFTSHR